MCFSTASGYFDWKRLEKNDFFTLLVTGVDSETRGDGTVGVEDLVTDSSGDTNLNDDTIGDGDRVEDEETSGDTNGDGDEDLLNVTGVKSPSLLELW